MAYSHFKEMQTTTMGTSRAMTSRHAKCKYYVREGAAGMKVFLLLFSRSVFYNFPAVDCRHLDSILTARCDETQQI